MNKSTQLAYLFMRQPPFTVVETMGTPMAAGKVKGLFQEQELQPIPPVFPQEAPNFFHAPPPFSQSPVLPSSAYYAPNSSEMSRVAVNAHAAGSKDKHTALILALLFGWAGVHYFYLGDAGEGIKRLLLIIVGLIFAAFIPDWVGAIVTFGLFFATGFLISLVDVLNFSVMSQEKFHSLHG
ncbi:MAG: TM2 domain-containing protein [Planctomycetia bacterium]|nr:TM2 domain-containing protein [Planctomycetia bacterium]